MKSQLVNVLITYNILNAMPREALAHEIPILRVVHGENNVKFLSHGRVVGEVRPRAEFLRLKEEYKGLSDGQGTNPADVAFPDGSRDLEILLKEGLESFEKLTAAVVEDDEPDFEEVEEVEEEEEIEAEAPDQEGIPERPAIIAALVSAKADFSANTPTRALYAQLQKLRAAS